MASCPGLANVDPHGYVRLWDAAQAGDWAAARAEQERLCRLFEIVWVACRRTSAGSAGVGAFKTAMRSLGVIATNDDGPAAARRSTPRRRRRSTRSSAPPGSRLS